MAEVHELTIIARERLQAMIGCFDEDLGLVSGGPEDALNAEDLMTDRVAVAERGEDLVNASHGHFQTGPFGSLPTTPSAGGRSCRRRSNHPGSRSGVAAAVSFFS